MKATCFSFNSVLLRNPKHELDEYCKAFPCFGRIPASILFAFAEQLFVRSLQQFDRIRKRNAFLDQYRREPMFADNLSEFDSSR